MSIIAIRDLQGESYNSPFANQLVTTTGIVTGVMRRGFFLQTPDKAWDQKGSDAIFVYSPDWAAELGSELEVTGECVDFIKHETAKPVTQIHFESVRVKSTRVAEVEPIVFSREFLPEANSELAKLLNSLEGMLVAIEAGQTFIAPSNRYGDYVVTLDANISSESSLKQGDLLRAADGGVVVDPANPQRWFPGFRVTNYNHAQRLNVGAKLLSRIQGPLNYRVDAYQIAMNQPFKSEPNFISLTKSSLKPSTGSVTIMTLNCFNLDPHVESEHKVINPRQDIDDDWGEGRFHTLAQAVALQANQPDIVALQEIQDNDGAEVTEVTDASKTYGLLVETIEQLCGLRYDYVDVAPELGADGGQPGGNIRNGFLYNAERVSLDPDSVKAFGHELDCFIGSRKPLLCEFVEKGSGQRVAVINVHLASKRHQESIFAPVNPGVDAKLPIRIEQTLRVRQEIERLSKEGVEYYVTGDFNDMEHSKPLKALTDGISINLVDLLPLDERYDYNHRGKLQVLMHGIVSIAQAEKSEYEIIHGNELIGVTPGEDSDKPSDHAYVIAKLKLS